MNAAEAALSSPIYLKRTYSEDEDDDLQPLKRQREDSSNLTEIVIIDDFSYAVKNVVWMNASDIDVLFRDVPSRTINNENHKYIHLANRVYRIGITEGLPLRTIGLTSLQLAAVKASSFMRDQNQRCWISPCIDKIKDIPYLDWVDFDISHFRPESRDILGRDVVNIDDINKCISRTFSQYALNFKQKLLLKYRNEQYVLTVDKMTPVNANLFHKYGIVSSKTNFRLRVNENSKIALTDNVIKDKAAKIIFRVELSSSYVTEHFPTLPLVLDIERLREMIFRDLGNQSMVIGQEFKINQAPNCPLYLTLKTFELKGSIYDSSWIASMLSPQTGFQLDNKQQIHFNANSNHVLLTKKEVQKAKAIDFEVHFIGYIPGEGSPHDKIHWIDVSALKKKIVESKKELCKTQIVTHDIGKKRYFLRVLKGFPLRPFVHEKDSGKVHWEILPDTALRFCAGTSVQIPLVDSAEPRPVKEAVFKILPFDRKMPKVTISEDEIIRQIQTTVTGPFVTKQTFTISVDASRIKVSIESFSFEKSLGSKPVYGNLGKLEEGTRIKVENANNDLVVQAQNKIRDLDPAKVLRDKRLGGITKEFDEIYSTVILQTLFKDEFQMLDIPLERGLLLYGEPGNGKTKVAAIVAEQLGCTLNNGRLIMKSGTDVFIKWVGDSEAEVRKIFAPAFKAYDQYHDEAELYVIIIDEIDGMLKKRKNRDVGSDVSENVVNTFLTCMDGLKKLPNVLVIGMTNRKDLLDPAALRFGRLSKHIEFKNPNQKSRLEIFEVLSEIIKQIRCLGADVDFSQLAKETEDFSSADIAGVVSYAFKARCARLARLKIPPEEKAKHKDNFVTMDDFRKFITEVKEKKKDSLDKPPPEGMYG